MSIICKSCKETLSADYGENTPETKCPNCGVPLVREITIQLEAHVFGVSGAEATLTVTTYPEALLAEVKDLTDRGKFTLAVVVAQMACEISVERALRRAFSDRGFEDLQDTVMDMLPGRSITNDKVRKLYDRLTSNDVCKHLPWEGLILLNKRRNGAIHGGQTYESSEASEALSVATKLVEYFKP